MTFKISAAGLIIEIQSRYDDVYKLCSDYLTDRTDISFSVHISDSELAREHSESAGAGHQTRKPKRAGSSDGYLETLAVYRKIAVAALDYHTFLMHGSLIATDGNGYLLTAPSGTGKTTRTELWLKTIPNSFIVNGDKPLIQVGEHSVIAYGTPWCGKEGKNTNTGVPLRAIYFLERADQSSEQQTVITELSGVQAFSKLLQQTYRPGTAEDMIKTLHLLEGLDGKVRFFRFCSTLEPDTVQTAFAAANESHGEENCGMETAAELA